MSKKLKLYKVRDSSDKDYIHTSDKIPDAPVRALVIGRSQLSGKSTIIFNYLCRADLMKNVYKPENIYIVSASMDTDPKLNTMIDYLEIPRSNTFSIYDEGMLERVYEEIRDVYLEGKTEGKTIHSCIIIDDCSFGNNFTSKKSGVVARIYQNGRHVCCSCWISAQHYSDIPTAVRNNATAVYLFQMNRRQTDAIVEDHSFIDPKIFRKKLQFTTKEPHSFMFINYNNRLEKRYLDSDFDYIDMGKLEDC
tara:strand:- start:1484 stop:2233 length:750 start_codon:yes stop_codon:yes gene_type:complete